MLASLTRSVRIAGRKMSVALCDVAADGNCLFTTLGEIVQPQLPAAEVRDMVVNFHLVAGFPTVYT